MARIRVLAKVGDTVHPRYGRLTEGQELEIEEADFGEEIFRRKGGECAYEAGEEKTEGNRKKEHRPLQEKNDGKEFDAWQRQ